ncbi:MAG: hypothetical protein HYU58_11700 [Proteobacteria bacterium]|nr:hypothetical protein [Pseudomonadota bacterium]
MACYLVTYDLNAEVKRPPIVKTIKSFGAWAKLSESSYAIVSSGTAEQVYNSLVHLIDQNDELRVIPIRQNWFGWGYKTVNDWLDKNLPQR